MAEGIAAPGANSGRRRPGEAHSYGVSTGDAVSGSTTSATTKGARARPYGGRQSYRITCTRGAPRSENIFGTGATRRSARAFSGDSAFASLERIRRLQPRGVSPTRR